jgi:putative inorganic carbon (HCO3(-)) transporter
MASYGSILVTNFFGFSISVVQLLFYVLPAMLVVYAGRRRERVLQLPGAKAVIGTWTYPALALLIFVFGLLQIGRFYAADMAYARGDLHLRSGNYQTAYQYLSRALSYRYDHVYQDKLSTALAQLALLAQYQNEVDLAQDLIPLSQEQNRESIMSSPFNVLYRKTTSKNNYLYYQTTLDPAYLKEAIAALEQAEVLSPTDPRIPYSQALFYSLLADEATEDEVKTQYQQKALDHARRSIELKPDYRDAVQLYASLLSKYEQNEEAAGVIQRYLDVYNPNDQELIEQQSEVSQ